MQRRWYCWGGCLALAAAVTVATLTSHLSAQGPAPGAGTAMQPGNPIDEIAPRLISNLNGGVFRLWQRWIDLQTGGGGVFLALASPPSTWQKILELLPSEAGVSILEPDVAFGSAKEIALAYQWRRHYPRTKQLRLSRSDDGGKTWTHSSTPLDGSGKAFTPKLGWGRGRNLVVVWADERRKDRTWDIYARRSPDGGLTWEPEQLLSRFSRQTTADLYARPEMVTDGQDHFWAVWVGLRSGRSSLYLSRSADGGRTWADPVALSGQSESVFGHRLVRSGPHLLLVWQDTRTGKDRIYSVASSDGGVTWSSPTRVDHLPEESQAEASSAAVTLGPGGEAIVAWQDGRNGRDDIFVATSQDAGRTWGQDTRLDMDEPGTAISRSAGIARAEDGRIAVAWEDDRAGYEGIYLRVRTAGPSPAWGPEVLLAPPGVKTGARTPSLAWGPRGEIYSAWEVWDHSRGSLATVKQVDGRIFFPDKK